MRLFVAIDVPERVKQSLQEIQDPGLGIRWMTPDTIHLTLRFIGDVDGDTRDKLISTLAGIQAVSFSMTIKGIGYFPPRKRPNVVWVGIEENEALMKLQSDVEAACRDVGLEPDERPFTPHITIGRVKKASKNEVLSYIDRFKELQLGDIVVEEFILYESDLHPDGAVHTPLKRFSLKAGSNSHRSTN